jgi:hypothetical protein
LELLSLTLLTVQQEPIHPTSTQDQWLTAWHAQLALIVWKMEQVLKLVTLLITAHLVLELQLSTLANQDTIMMPPGEPSSKAVCAVDSTNIVQVEVTTHQLPALLEHMSTRLQMLKSATSVQQATIVKD